MTTMRAMVLHRGGRLSVEEVERPEPGPGQVLARVRASGICGSDLHFARYAEQMIEVSRRHGPAGWGRIDLDRGVVMGHEFAAEVVETGPGVEGWSPGDRVVSIPTLLDREVAGGQTIGYSSSIPGAYGEYVIMSAPLLQRLPDGLDFRLAATTEPCAVGLHAVREARLQPGERALVMGAGPIGLMTMLWLKREGVPAAVSDPAPARRALAERIGAAAVFDPSPGGLGSAVEAALAGPPALVFECVGVEGTLAEAMELAGRRGRVVVAGVCMTEDRLRPMVGINKHLTLQFVLGYTPQEFSEALTAIGDGSVDVAPLVTRSVTLDELPSAFALLSDPRDCKVMLELP